MKDLNIDKIYTQKDFLEFLVKFRKAKNFKIIKREPDYNIIICKIDRKQCLITTELLDELIEKKILY